MIEQESKRWYDPCLEKVFECVNRILEWRRNRSNEPTVPMAQNVSVVLDMQMKGTKAQVSRYCLSGNGTALANVCVEQSCAYWEVEVVTPGVFRVGVSQKPSEDHKDKLDDQIGDKIRSWSISTSELELEEKSIIGIFYDQRELPEMKFSVDGVMLDESHRIKGIKGDVFPAASITSDAILRFRFDEHSLKYPPAGAMKKFSAIIPARSVI